MQRIIAEFGIFMLVFVLWFAGVVYIVIIRKGIFPSKQEYLSREDLSKEQINTCLKIKKYFEIPFMIIITVILILGMAIAFPIFQDAKLIIPYDSYHESQITIPTIRGNRTSNTLFSSTCKVADAQ